MRVIDLASLSLAGGSGIAEAKIPLWWADGTTGSNGGTTSSTPSFVRDGSTGGTTAISSVTELFTLSSSCSSSQKYAFEATIAEGTSGYTATMVLWDMTSNAQVASSQITSTSTALAVIRSGTFTLTPGHQYGVASWSTNASYAVVYSDASLIIFP